MMKRLAVLALLFALPGVAKGQTQKDLDHAIDLYNQFQIEQATPIFLQIISPTNLLQVTPQQKATAEKYLGASYAVRGKPDSASLFFQAMLQFDPFTDLDSKQFGAAEISAFNAAKQGFFNIGIQPLSADTLNPRSPSDVYTFRLITTHRAHITVQLVNQKDTSLAAREPLFDGTVDGVKDVAWNGMLRNGRIADSTTYEFRITGNSLLPALNNVAGNERATFRVEYATDSLESTVDTLSGLLDSTYKSAGAWADLARGTLAVGGAAFGISMMLNHQNLHSWTTNAALGMVLGLASGIGSAVYRLRHPQIDANVAENRRRQHQRALFNQAVQQRNQARIAATRLILTPLGR